MQWRLGSFEVDTDRDRIDFERVFTYLKTTYWSSERSREEVEAAWAHTHLQFGLYDMDAAGIQIGCARVVTDTRTFGWLADVFVDPQYRGKGVGKFMIGCVAEHPDCARLRLFFLGTRDAQEFYGQFRWETPRYPERFMARYPE